MTLRTLNYLAVIIFLFALPARAQMPGGTGPGGPGGRPGADMELVVRDVANQLIDVPTSSGAISRAYVARPRNGSGPYPAILLLHGTEGFAAPQVMLADDFGKAGFVAVAACWFKGTGCSQGRRRRPTFLVRTGRNSMGRT